MTNFEKLRFRRSNLLENILSTHTDPSDRKKYLQRAINRAMPGEKYREDSKEFIVLKSIIEKKISKKK